MLAVAAVRLITLPTTIRREVSCFWVSTAQSGKLRSPYKIIMCSDIGKGLRHAEAYFSRTRGLETFTSVRRHKAKTLTTEQIIPLNYHSAVIDTRPIFRLKGNWDNTFPSQILAGSFVRVLTNRIKVRKTHDSWSFAIVKGSAAYTESQSPTHCV